MALLALSHTQIEQQIYEQMLLETTQAATRVGAFDVRHLMQKTGIHDYSHVRRAREGLIKKLSIEPQRIAGSFFINQVQASIVYFIYHPAEIFERRQKAGLVPYPKQMTDGTSSLASIELVKRLMTENRLSKREAQVALKCAEGLSNADIGQKLFIQQETVKFHLRNIFVKFGIRKRTELMVRLLRQPVSKEISSTKNI